MTLNIKNFKEWIIALRNDFHQHPELSSFEKRTTRKIYDILKTMGVDVCTFEDITGVVGLLRGKKNDKNIGRTIALRADIDALPMQESGNRRHKSINDGIMHSCGHDANIAILLGVARKVVESGLLEKNDGAVKFIFQPAEEDLGGAISMIERGVLENPRVDHMIAGHMDPSLPVGTVGIFSHIGHSASDSFKLVITGRGAHGARPHEGINPITAGGKFITTLESLVPRLIRTGRTAVISIGAFHSGDAENVIPEQAVMKGSIRTHDEGVRNQLFKAMEQLSLGIEVMYDVKCQLVFQEGAPLGLNDEDVCKSLYTASVDVLGSKNVKVLPFIMGSDDFYYFARKCPAAMMRFGCGSPEDGITHSLHSPGFDIHEDVLEIGADILFKAVENFFISDKEERETDIPLPLTLEEMIP